MNRHVGDEKMTQTTEENTGIGMEVKIWLLAVLGVIVSWYFIDVRSANFWESTVAFYALLVFGLLAAVQLLAIMLPTDGSYYGDSGGPWFSGNGGEGGGGDGGGW